MANCAPILKSIHLEATHVNSIHFSLAKARDVAIPNFRGQGSGILPCARKEETQTSDELS